MEKATGRREFLRLRSIGICLSLLMAVSCNTSNSNSNEASPKQEGADSPNRIALSLGDNLADLHYLFLIGAESETARRYEEITVQTVRNHAAKLEIELPPDELSASYDPHATEIVQRIKRSKGSQAAAVFAFAYHAKCASWVANKLGQPTGSGQRPDFEGRLLSLSMQFHGRAAVGIARLLLPPKEISGQAEAIEEQLSKMSESSSGGRPEEFKAIYDGLNGLHSTVLYQVYLSSVQPGQQVERPSPPATPQAERRPSGLWILFLAAMIAACLLGAILFVHSPQREGLHIACVLTSLACGVASGFMLRGVLGGIIGGLVAIVILVVAYISVGRIWVRIVLAGVRSRSTRIRKRCAQSLKELKDPLAVTPLISLLQHRDPGVRLEVFYLLRELEAPLAAKPLISLLQRQDLRIRSKIIDALGESRDPLALEPIIPFLGDEDWDLRFAAANALGNLAFSDLKDPRATEPLTLLLKDPAENLRAVAAHTLWYIHDPRSVDALIDALDDDDPRVQSGAMRALGAIGNPKAIGSLTKLLRHKSQSCAEDAAKALENLASGATVNLALSLIEQDDLRIRLTGIRMLGKGGTKKAVEALIALLSDPLPLIRREAIAALTIIKDERSRQPLLNKRRDDDRVVRQLAAIALAEMGDRSLVKELIECSNDPENILDLGLKLRALHALRKVLSPGELAVALAPVRREGRFQSGQSMHDDRLKEAVAEAVAETVAETAADSFSALFLDG